MDNQHFYELLERYLAGTASDEERRTVEGWYNQLTAGDPDLSTREQQRIDSIVLQQILERTQAASPSFVLPQPQQPVAKQPGVAFLYRKPWFRFAAASFIIIMLGAIGWIIQTVPSPKPALTKLPMSQRFKNEISPASQGVTLDLGNNKKILLDSLQNGTLSLAGAVNIQKKDAALTYSPGANHVSFHTVTTGKGKNYTLVLADGTKVWLDAESSVYFPTAFPSRERRVKVTGQAYFEVQKDRLKPFRVEFQNQVVEVLGTHFNINAHEAEAHTTLLEGSVRLKNTANQTKVLVPGQQATLLSNGQWDLIADADIDEVMAWKNGVFRFNGASIPDIMSQLERWYDIKVVYTAQINDVALVARINRSENLTTVLSLLEMTGQVWFTINGNMVSVMNSKPEGQEAR